jgi:serine/threonine-protein kinase
MTLKKCPNCAFDNPETAKFCNECGVKLSPEKSLPSEGQGSPKELTQPTPSEPPSSVPVVAPVETLLEAPEAGPALLAKPTQPEPPLIPDETQVRPAEPTPLSPSEAPLSSPEKMPPPAAPSESSETAETLSVQLEALPFGWIEPTPPPLEPDEAPLAPGKISLEPAAPSPEGWPEAAAPAEATGIPAVPAGEAEAPASAPGELQPAEAETAAEEYPVEELSSKHPFGERFKIIEELGAGTLGTVYKVYDKAMERELALKAVKPEISQKAEAFDGFVRELRIERGMVHKNIARIFELFVLKGSPFITMEYVAGRTLKSLLKEKKRLPVMEAFSLAKQLFTGLDQAHKAGALHLDLRPDNIMVDNEGTAKIMDLGISRLFRAKGIIRAGAGMPQYMSPEQLEGREGDARSDIFAAGAIIYEMLTGNLPPVGVTPRSPREINPGVPRELSLLVLKCLEQEKERRYQTAREVRAELEEIETAVAQAPAEPLPTLMPQAPAEPRPVLEPSPATPMAQERVFNPAEAGRKLASRRGFSLPRKAVLPALAVLAVIILAIAAWRLFFKPSESAPPVPPSSSPGLSLAVLPYEDLSPAKDRQYLGAAMAEALIRSLGKVDGLFIPAAASSSTFQGKSRDSRLVGRRLHVDTYLEGTFEERENRVKIDARLIKADSGAPLWSGLFERSSGEIFALQQEIAQAVVKFLGVAGPNEPTSAAPAATPASFEAFDLYAQGRFLLSKGGKANLEKAVDLFAKSGAKNPTFAQALEGLSHAYVQLAEGHHLAPDKAFSKAKDAALRALLLDSKLAEAHTALGKIKMEYEWDFVWAEKEFKEALRLDPENAAAHQSYALLLSALGRHREAASEIQAAQALNPLSSEVNSQAGLVLYFSRLYEQAEAEFKKALATDPNYPGHHLGAALLQVQWGQFDAAARSLAEAEDLGADPMEVNLRRAYIQARQGQRQEAGRILTAAFNAAKKVHVSHLSLALVYAGLNERDQAIACLENAFADRDAMLIFMRVHPFLDPVRGDLRFVSLLQKMGLGPY